MESHGVEAGLLALTWPVCSANDQRRAFTALHSLEYKAIVANGFLS
jgi:hypothetical protein